MVKFSLEDFSSIISFHYLYRNSTISFLLIFESPRFLITSIFSYTIAGILKTDVISLDISNKLYKPT